MIDWQTIDVEHACNDGYRLDATEFIPAGAHYKTDIDCLPVLGRIVGREHGPYRTLEVEA